MYGLFVVRGLVDKSQMLVRQAVLCLVRALMGSLWVSNADHLTSKIQSRLDLADYRYLRGLVLQLRLSNVLIKTAVQKKIIIDS